MAFNSKTGWRKTTQSAVCLENKGPQPFILYCSTMLSTASVDTFRLVDTEYIPFCSLLCPQICLVLPFSQPTGQVSLDSFSNPVLCWRKCTCVHSVYLLQCFPSQDLRRDSVIGIGKSRLGREILGELERRYTDNNGS